MRGRGSSPTVKEGSICIIKALLNSRATAPVRSFGAPPDVPMMVLVSGRDRPPHWVKSMLNECGPWVSLESGQYYYDYPVRVLGMSMLSGNEVSTTMR